MNQTDPKAELNFEKAIEEIQAIVEAIEEGKLPLDESIKKYERGLYLIKECQKALMAANQKIEKITLDSDKESPDSRQT